MSKLIYLATPYTHESHSIMEERYVSACQIVRELIVKLEVFPISPIVQWHPIAQDDYKLGRSFNSWKEYNTELLKACDELYLASLPGWLTSIGMQAEIDIAREFRKPITLLTFNEFGLSPDTTTKLPHNLASYDLPVINLEIDFRYPSHNTSVAEKPHLIPKITDL